MNVDYDENMKMKEKIAELSSRFYELIPHSQYKDSMAPVIRH